MDLVTLVRGSGTTDEDGLKVGSPAVLSYLSLLEVVESLAHVLCASDMRESPFGHQDVRIFLRWGHQ